MLLAHERAELRLLVERVTDAQLSGGCRQPLEELAVDRALDEQAAAGEADLALVAEDPADRADDRLVEIRVGEDQVRGLAAQLERHALQIVRGGLHDRLSGLRGPGEGDEVDARIADEGLAGGLGAEALHDVEDARRKDLGRDLSEQGCGRRRLLGGLQHHRVAERERGRDLPRGEHQGEVPRGDRDRDALRLVPRVGEMAGHRMRLRRRREILEIGEEAEVPRHAGQIVSAGLADGLAHVARLRGRELGGPLVDAVGEPVQQLSALRGRQAGPRAVVECAARGGHGPVRVLAPALGDGRVRLPHRRIDGDEGLAVARVHELSIDQVAEVREALPGPARRVRRRGLSHRRSASAWRPRRCPSASRGRR